MKTFGDVPGTGTGRAAGLLGLCGLLMTAWVGLAAATTLNIEVRHCSNDAPVPGVQITIVSKAPNCTPATCTVFSGTTSLQGQVSVVLGDPDDLEFIAVHLGQHPIHWEGATQSNNNQLTWQYSGGAPTGACSLTGSGTTTLVLKVNN